MQFVVDSSVLVAAFRPQEKNSASAFKLLRLVEAGAVRIIIPVTVLIEVVAAIRRRTERVVLAAQVGQKLLSFTSFSLIDLTAFRLISYLTLAEKTGLRGMDVVVVGVAAEFDLPLLTLDDEIANRTPKSIRVIDFNYIFDRLP